MQIRGGMWGVECPVVRTTETYACIAQCDRGQWSEPCELYILRRKSETDFGRYTSYFRTAFESLYQKRDCILLYAWRNLEGSNRWLSIIYQTTLAAGKNGLSFLLKGRPDLLTATIKGISAFIRIPHKKE